MLVIVGAEANFHTETAQLHDRGRVVGRRSVDLDVDLKVDHDAIRLKQWLSLTPTRQPAMALSGRPAQIVSRLRPGVKLAENFVHGVDDRLRLVQLNMVT
jgi:hypothetical protein